MHLTTDTFPKILVLLVFMLIVGAGSAFSNEAEPPPVFLTENQTSKTGHIKLIWEAAAISVPEAAVVFELQESTHPDFSDARLVYTGSDQASFLSGLIDGTYYYRLRRLNKGHFGPWSEPITIQVKHHSLPLALLLFGVGFIVVVATFLVVLRGSLQPVELSTPVNPEEIGGAS